MTTLTVLVKRKNGARCFLAPSRAEELIDRGLAEVITASDMRPLERERYQQIMREMGEAK